jgi:hypothetical protein
MLTEETLIDLVEVVECGNLQVREASIIKRDGVEIARTFHRYLLRPGDSLEGQPNKVTAIANAVWPQE